MRMSMDASRTYDAGTRGISGSAITLKRALLLSAKYGGLFAMARVLTARKTRILAYHGIWLGEGHYGNFLYMSGEKFASRMALLQKWGYPVVSLADSAAGKSRYRCPTVITIDDGWYGTWLEMLPVLERHGYPATVYLTTYYCLNQAPVIDVALSYCLSVIDTNKSTTLHLPTYDFGPVRLDDDTARKGALTAAKEISASLDDDVERQRFLKALCDQAGIDHARILADRWFNLMNPAEVKNAARRGMDFQLHTHHHRITDRGRDCLAEEIAENRECIRRLTGRVPEHFCYPSGRFSSALWPGLEKAHVSSATTTDIGLVNEKTPRYAMPRILDGQDVTELEFEAEMSGFLELARIVRGWGKGKQ